MNFCDKILYSSSQKVFGLKVFGQDSCVGLIFFFHIYAMKISLKWWRNFEMNLFTSGKFILECGKKKLEPSTVNLLARVSTRVRNKY